MAQDKETWLEAIWDPGAQSGTERDIKTGVGMEKLMKSEKKKGYKLVYTITTVWISSFWKYIMIHKMPTLGEAG